MSKKLNALRSAGRLKLVSWLMRTWRKLRPSQVRGQIETREPVVIEVQADQIPLVRRQVEVRDLIEEQVEHVQGSSGPAGSVKLVS